jgi:quercetin dioxygenase-like cupin family protein
MGYVISGNVCLEVGRAVYKAGPGDLIYLTAEIPSQWKNPGPGDARLLWIKIQ